MDSPRCPARRLAALALPFAAALLACGRPDPPPRAALLVTLDTTRADAIGAFGGAPDTSPRIDAFAAAALRFTRAYTTAPLTLPAHASMLTGLYPPRHGVRDNGRNPLPDAAESAVEIARAAGLQTAAFVSAAVLGPGFGLAQGFDVYDAPGDTGAQHGSDFPSRAAVETVARAEAWLRERDPGRGFLLWVHLWEPHAPYTPPPGFERDDPYLGEVAAADDAFGRLLDALVAAGLADTTAVVLVSDHGEAFGEHGEWTHGALCFEPTLRVPLVVSAPGLRGGADERIASVADVAPTLLAALGLPAPDGLDGRSLTAPPAPGGVYFESLQGWYLYGWSPLRGWIDHDGKFWQGGRERFFDPQRDPDESRDWLAAPGVPDAVSAAVERGREALVRLEARPRLPAAPAVPSELRAQIEALGYAVASAGGGEPEDDLGRLPDPADRAEAGELERVSRITELAGAGRFEEAAAVCEELLAANPNQLFALEMLGTFRAALGDPEEAIRALGSVVARGRANERTYGNLARALHQVGRDDEARVQIREALRRRPEHRGFRALAAELGVFDAPAEPIPSP